MIATALAVEAYKKVIGMASSGGEIRAVPQIDKRLAEAARKRIRGL